MNSLLQPAHQIAGQEPHWRALGTSPEFHLNISIPADGGWLFLAWATSLTDTISRPILIFDRKDATGTVFQSDHILSGASFGAQQATVFVPSGTTSIRFSPVHATGRFSFQMTAACWLSTFEVFLNGFFLQPLVALHALGALLIRRLSDFRLLLTEAIGARPIEHYARWKKERSRNPEWDRLDTFPLDRHPRLRIVTFEWEGDPLAMEALPELLRPSWHNLEAPYDWHSACMGLSDKDLVLLVPKRAVVLQESVPSLLRAAEENPDSVFFFGDEEFESPSGLSCMFSPGFDPLLSFDKLKETAVFGLRVAALRNWSRGEAPIVRPNGLALYRPLARRGNVPINTAAPEILDWLEKGWFFDQEIDRDQPIDVAIIIPTRDRLELLRACIESIEHTLPCGTEIIVIDNESKNPETLFYLQSLEQTAYRKVFYSPGPFNFSKLCNSAAKETRAKVLVFLNNDTTARTDDWISHLFRFAIKPQYGAVGARLLYPSGRVQHAGVIIGIGGYAGHFELHLAGSADGFFARARQDHTLLAVTGACLAVERTKFEAVGGFDEENLPVDLSDIDLCLRLNEKGWQTVYSAGSELVHHESASRGRKLRDARYLKEKAYFGARWRNARRADPHFHPALSLLLTRPSLG